MAKDLSTLRKIVVIGLHVINALSLDMFPNIMSYLTHFHITWFHIFACKINVSVSQQQDRLIITIIRSYLPLSIIRSYLPFSIIRSYLPFSIIRSYLPFSIISRRFSNWTMIGLKCEWWIMIIFLRLDLQEIKIRGLGYVSANNHKNSISTINWNISIPVKVTYHIFAIYGSSYKYRNIINFSRFTSWFVKLNFVCIFS